LAGLPVATGRAFVVSEEREADWRPRFEHLGIRDHVDLLCRPFPAQPTMDQWLALIETAADLRRRQGTDLVVIDSLSKFLPAHSENTAGALLECLTPLQGLTAAGMSVLLPHHPSKGKTVPGQAARGSGALPSFVDIIIEMGYYSQPDDLDRRRRLLAFSRYEETPRHLLIELQADGTDYVVLQSGLEAALGEAWPALLHSLSDAFSKLTREEILDNWPPDYTKPESITLWRWLGRAVAQGLVRQEGAGHKRDPFRYWLPARELMMRPDKGTMEEMVAWNERYVAELMDRMGISNGARPPEGAPPSADKADLDDRKEHNYPASPTEESALAADEEDPPGLDLESPEEGTTVLDSAPTIDAELTPGPDSITPDTLPSSDPLPTPAAPPVRAENVAHLPYPFNTMKPEDVPEEVWKRARAGQTTAK
jgi:hypothetical protein